MTSRQLITALYNNKVVAVRFGKDTPDNDTLGKLEGVDAATGWATVSQGSRKDEYPVDKLAIVAVQ